MTTDEKPAALSGDELERLVASLTPKKLGSDVLVWTLTNNDNEFIEMSATRNVIEVTRGVIGDAGHTRRTKVKLGESVATLVYAELARILGEGFRQAPAVMPQAKAPPTDD